MKKIQIPNEKQNIFVMAEELDLNLEKYQNPSLSAAYTTYQI